MTDSIILAQMKMWLSSAADGPSILRRRSVVEMNRRVQIVVAERSAEDDDIWLGRLHRKAALSLGNVQFSTPRPKPARIVNKRSASASQSTGSSGNAKRQRAMRVSQLAPVPEAEEVTSISRVSGRQRKAPRKFKEVTGQPDLRTGRWASASKVRVVSRTADVASSTPMSKPSSARSESRDVRTRSSSAKHSAQSVLFGKVESGAAMPVKKKHFTAASPRRKSEGTPPGPAESLETRIGARYQADVPLLLDHASPSEHDDELVWSEAQNTLSDERMEAYMAAAVQILSGPPTQPLTQKRMQAASQELFPEERAYQALHSAGYNPDAALRLLRTACSGLGDQPRAWTNGEVRHLRSGVAKFGSDVAAIQELVKTKDLKSTLRLFYIEKGLKKRSNRDKESELRRAEAVRASPSATPVALPSQPSTPPRADDGANDGADDGADVDVAEDDVLERGPEEAPPPDAKLVARDEAVLLEGAGATPAPADAEAAAPADACHNKESDNIDDECLMAEETLESLDF